MKLYPTELAPILAGFGLDPRGFQVVVETKEGGTDALVLRVKAAAVPEELADAVRRTTGLRVDRIDAAGKIEGGLVVDRRFG